MKTLFILISLVLSLAHGAGAGAVPAAGAGAVPAAVECCQIAPMAGKMPPVIVVIRADDGADPSEYKRLTTVCALEPADDAVIVVDSDGELWEFYGVEDWAVGDYCELTMIDTGKPGYKWDDEITRTIYKGVNQSFE